MTFRVRRSATRLGGAITAMLATGLTTGLLASSAAAATDDPFRDQQWNLDQVKAEPAWSTTRGEGATVAVVDSGVDLDHPDLAGRLVPGITTVNCPGKATTCGDGDWVGADGKAQDADIHGTHVAGIIAAAAGNGTGVAGVAPGATVMPVKALEDGTGTTENLATGIRWAADHGADVINMSLGGAPGTELLTVIGLDSAWTDAVTYAQRKGATVVAAAGNSTYPFCSSPANVKGVVCVTATDRNQLPAYYSNLGLAIDLDVDPASLLNPHTVAGPGGQGLLGCQEDVLSSVPVGSGGGECGNGSYDAFAGTSMAAPAVAGVAALLHSQCRAPANVLTALEQTAAVPLIGKGMLLTPWYGHGVVNAEVAVAHEGARC